MIALKTGDHFDFFSRNTPDAENQKSDHRSMFDIPF